jgi:heme/copper-type cytochrome/quinol oxidase subunit 4
MSFYIEKTQICLILKLLNYMQFRKNTSRDKFFNISFMLKTIIAIFIIVFGFILINQINLPAPIKQIEKILPNENFKTIK